MVSIARLVSSLFAPQAPMEFVVPKGLEAAVQERERFDELRSRFKEDPDSLSTDELQELQKLDEAYRQLREILSTEQPFSDY